MVYNYVSSDVVIAKLIRATRMTDSTYADDILEWLGEGASNFRLKNALVPKHFCIKINDNVGRIPCGAVMFDGIYYNGCRLRLGTGSVDTRVNLKANAVSNITSYFATDTQSAGFTDNSQSYLLVRGADLKQLTEFSNTDYYIPYADHIQTSFKCGEVILFYRGMPSDKNGLPQIPDEQNAINAMMWYIMSQLAIGGYKFPDAKMDYDYCDKKFYFYLREAKKKIKYWSTDKKEAFLNYWVNLVPQRSYYEHFSINGEQPKPVNL